MWVERSLPPSVAESELGDGNLNNPPSMSLNGTFLRPALALDSGSNVKSDSKTADFLIKLYI
jgi:hypothetical protein